MQEKFLSLPQIFKGCMLAELPVDEELNKLTLREYGLDIKDSLEVFSIWMGTNYDRQVAKVRQIVETYTGRVADYSSTIIESVRQHQLLVILYHCQNREKIQKRYVEDVGFRRFAGHSARFRSFSGHRVMEWPGFRRHMRS